MNPFSLLIAALMSSNKFLDDARYSNRWWSKVSEMPLPDVNRAESEFLHILGYGLSVSPREYDSWVERMQRFARMIEESERHGDLSPSVSPNMPPPMNPAIPSVTMTPQQPPQQPGVSAASVAAALAQQRSPRSPHHYNQQHNPAHLQRMMATTASPLHPAWVMAGPPPPGSHMNFPGSTIDSIVGPLPTTPTPDDDATTQIPTSPKFIRRIKSRSPLPSSHIIRPSLPRPTPLIRLIHRLQRLILFQQQEALFQLFDATADPPPPPVAPPAAPPEPVDPAAVQMMLESHPGWIQLVQQNPNLDLGAAVAAFVAARSGGGARKGDDGGTAMDCRDG
ncbi:hypothetical protein BC829DRAFT_489008 [Chytridium lagenaria]|nr:hypothetical protein BC829DRAFT_489008 [Chytridium lagenaria]